MPQSGGLYADLTVRETLRFFSRLRGASFESARELLEEVRLGHALEARVSDLSGGMAQKLAFALALVGSPPVLLLDEPTASLDAASRGRLLKKLVALKTAGTTIVLSTHSRRRPLTMADRAVAVEEGRVVAVGPSELGAHMDELDEERLHVDPRG
jgi:ABC-type multidrug transport system ATPase subunit